MKPHSLHRIVIALPLLLVPSIAALSQDGKTCSSPPARVDEVLGIRAVPGAFVTNVEPGSPAFQMGLQVCHLIAGFNGREFRASGNLPAFVGSMREAAMFSDADLEVWKPKGGDAGYLQDHVKVRIPLHQGSMIGASTTFQVLVADVLKGSPAEAAGVRPGDFIDEVDGEKVSNMRTITDLDQRIEAARQNGKVILTLAQWSPVHGSSEYKTQYFTREVTISF